MACLDMYNKSPPSQPPPPPPMSPRISFSNDFVESQNSNHFCNSRSELPPPASSDFEFSVINHNMLISADELFSKGRLLPFKESNNGCNNQLQRTLRDELDDDDDDDDVFSLKPPKNYRWKGFLSLRKSHIGSKKPDKCDDSFHDGKKFVCTLEDPNLTQSPEDMVSTEGPSSTDMEMET